MGLRRDIARAAWDVVMIYRVQWWCIDCPTRVTIERDAGPIEFYKPLGKPYFVCPACGGTVVHPDQLVVRGIEGDFGLVHRAQAKTTADLLANATEEHARLNAFWPTINRRRERTDWEAEGRRKGFIK